MIKQVIITLIRYIVY